jgi:hypothetical protein
MIPAVVPVKEVTDPNTGKKVKRQAYTPGQFIEGTNGQMIADENGNAKRSSTEEQVRYANEKAEAKRAAAAATAATGKPVPPKTPEQIAKEKEKAEAKAKTDANIAENMAHTKEKAAGIANAAAGDPVLGAASKIAGAAIAGGSTDAVAEGFKNKEALAHETAAKAGAAAQQHAAKANRDTISAGDQKAAAQDASINARKVANLGAAAGAGAAALNRETTAADYKAEEERADTQQKEAETMTAVEQANKGVAVEAAADAGARQAQIKDVAGHNAKAEAVNTPPEEEAPEEETTTPEEPAEPAEPADTPEAPPAPEEPAAEEPATPEEPAPEEPAPPEEPTPPEEAPPATEEPPAAPPPEEPKTPEEATPKEDKAANQRVTNAIEDLPNGEQYREAGVTAWLGGDEAWKAWAAKMNAGPAKKSPIGPKRTSASAGQRTGDYDEKTGEHVGTASPEQKANAAALNPNGPPGESMGNSDTQNNGGGDRRIKDIKRIISDMRLKRNKQAVGKIAAIVGRRF